MSREKTTKKIKARAAHSARRRSYTRVFGILIALIFMLLFGAVLYLTLG